MRPVPKIYLGIPLLNFLFAACLGLLMRLSIVDGLPYSFVFRNYTHAHSHVAVLGWVYMIIFSLYVSNFLPEWTRKYKILFWLTQLSVLGMLFSFPFQGYAAVSISFSSLHVIASYLFIYHLWKDTKHLKTLAAKLMRASLVFMFISTLGLWGMAPIMALKIPGNWDQLLIQLFLHFQFNGWFVFAVLALLFKRMKIKENALYKPFANFLSLSLFLTYGLIVTWYTDLQIGFWLNAAGIILQLLSVYYLYQILKYSIIKYKDSLSKIAKLLLYFSLFGFVFKILFQSFAIIPSIGKVANDHHHFVIGFIHLAMLAMISGFLFLLLKETPNFINQRFILNKGLILFVIGVLSTEALMFYQGSMFFFKLSPIQNFDMLLFIASCFLVVGVYFIALQANLASAKKPEIDKL